jgi:ABC-type oligopeptide transport system substrate-binding subunit
MNIPKVKSVIANDDYTLTIKFNNDIEKVYNTKPLLNIGIYSPLMNKEFFKQVKVDPGGYAVYWNGDIDICENELWCNGKIIS